MSRAPQFRTRTYYASLTPERLILLGGLGLLCIAMIGYGIGANVAGSSRGNGFMGLGLVLLVGAGLALGRTHRRSIRISEDSIAYDTGSQKVEIPWSDVREFAADPPEKRLFRTAIVGDGSRDLVVDSYTFKEYDQIVSLVEVAIRTRWRGAGGGS